MKRRILAGLLALSMVLTMLPMTVFADGTDGLSGWKQDEQTVQGDESDAVCEKTDNGLHLTAESDSGSYRGSNPASWPTVFVNDEVTETLAAAKDGETCYVEMTFTPSNDNSFGVFLNYTDPGNGFVVCYDSQSGWYWQVCSTSGATESYRGSGVKPEAETETTLRLEWQGSTLKSVIVDGTTLFSNLDMSSNTGTGFGIKCAKGADVLVTNMEYGVIPMAEETTISGTVTANGSPVSGAVVTLEDASYMPTGLTATTGTNGQFSFESTGSVILTEDVAYKVKVQADGYQVATVEAGEKIELEAEDANVYVNNFDNGDISMMDTLGNTGEDGPTLQVVEHNGSSALKITFNSGARDPNQVVDKSISFADGVFSFDVTLEATGNRFGANVRATASNNRIFMGENWTNTTWFWESWKDGTNKWDNAQATGCPISIPVGVTRNVRVEIVGSTITAYIDGIQVHTATLDANAPTVAGYAGFNTYYATSVIVDNFHIVSLDSDEPVPPATYTLSGTVTDEDGAVSGASVSAGGKSATTDANGAYSISGLEAGFYTVTVIATGHDMATESVTIGSANATLDVNLTKIVEELPELCVTDAAGENLEPDENGYYTIPGGGKITLDKTTFTVPKGVSEIYVSAADAQALKTTAKGNFAVSGDGYILLPNGDKVQAVDATGMAGVSSLYYALVNGKLVVSGNGDMTDWSTSGRNTPWYARMAEIREVVICDGLTSIGGYSFYGASGLTTVTLPASVTAISYNAFVGTGLTSIDLPEGLTKIGNSAFDGTKLTSVIIPGTVTEIGSFAFQNCTTLTSVELPEGLTKIGTSAFANTGLTAVSFPSSLSDTGSNAFLNCTGLTSVVIPSTITSIGINSFFGCTNLTDVTISDGVTTISTCAFKNCSSLTQINLPDSMTTIADGAFYGTGLTSIVIPEGVTSLGTNETKRTGRGDGVFQDCKALSSVTLPEGLEFIGRDAFNGCTALTQIELPSSVNGIGMYAFNESGLTSIVIPEGVTKIDEQTFHRCTALTEITLPSTLTEIGYLAFRETGLTSIVIPEGVTTIGGQAFYSCDNLTGITLPSTLTNISSDGAFKANTYTKTNLYAFVFNGDVTIPSNSISTFSGLTRVRYMKEAGYENCNVGPAYDAILNGGEIPAGTVFQPGKLVTPVKAGAEFLGWFDANDNVLTKQGDVYIIPATANVGAVFTAKWNENSQTHTHEWGEGVVTTKPTCTAKGVKAFTCACGETMTEEVAALGHTEVIDAAVEATCTTAGKTEGKHCSVCNTVLVAQTATALAPHTPGAAAHENEVPATCTKAGSYDEVVRCTKCNEVTSSVSKTIPATGHTSGAAAHENEVPATCTKAGSYDEVVYCTKCSEEISRVSKTISATGHTSGAAAHENEVPATCTKAGSYDEVVYCTKCNEVTSRETIVVDALGHDLVQHEGKAATCTEAGWTAYESCNRCDYSSTSEEIEALGHDFDGEYSHNVQGHWYTCARCGEETAVEAHTVVIDPEVAATETSTGLTMGSHCSVCGEVFVAQKVIPALEPSLDPTPEIPMVPMAPVAVPTTPDDPSDPGEEIEDPETPLANLPFIDVDADAWYAPSVTYAYSKGFMHGVSAMTFEPKASLTRGMMAQVIYNMSKNPESNVRVPFKDVNGRYYYPAVNWGVANGILKGYSSEIYGGEFNVTRQEMVTMLYRYTQYQNLGSEVNLSALDNFVDSDHVSGWAKEAMAWAVENDLIKGRGNNDLNPCANITRGEVAAVLERYGKLFLA